MKQRVIQLPAIVELETQPIHFGISSYDYDYDGIATDIYDAVNDALPEGIHVVTSIPEAIIEPGVELPDDFTTDGYWKELMFTIDVWGIVQKHEYDHE